MRNHPLHLIPLTVTPTYFLGIQYVLLEHVHNICYIYYQQGHHHL